MLRAQFIKERAMRNASGFDHSKLVRNEKQTSRSTGRKLRHRRRTTHPLVVERLEGRILLSDGLVSFNDDYGDTLASAQEATLDAAGYASLSGAIEEAGDIDMFRFVAPATGGVAIRLDADEGSSL